MAASTKSTKARGSRWTPEEREFVKTSYGILGPADIARKLGRSRSGVCALVKRMKESGEIEARQSTGACAESADLGPPQDGPDGRQDTLGKLRWVRRILERQLFDVSPSHAAQLARAYRETVDEIERLESAGEEGGGDELIVGALKRIREELG